MVFTPRDVEGQLDALLGDVKREIDISRRTRVFCNRNLRMNSIEYIGFDMDYTLALYQQDRLEHLSIELTLKKLMANHGYGAELFDLDYDPRWAIRGLVVDKELGNVFKMDRHGPVGRVSHGKRLLDPNQRKELYRNTRIQLSQDRFAWIDTLFGLPEAVMTDNTMIFHQPVRPGDVISNSQVLRSVSDPKTTKLGTGRFWVIDVEFRNQDRELVGVESYTGFGYVRAAA
jgi:hypothetical protein